MLEPVGFAVGGKRKKTVVTAVNETATRLAIGPRTGPRVQVGDGNDSGRRRWRPRTSRRMIGQMYEMLRRTTETERIALKAADEPKSGRKGA